jgi:hypothetical protein
MQRYLAHRSLVRRPVRKWDRSVILETSKTMTPKRPILRTGVLATVLLSWMLVLAPGAHAGELPATGQTTSYPAVKNGSTVPVAVPDDGALQRGAPPHYLALEDGTIKDLNTGLIWEVKCQSCGGLHDVSNLYPWSGNGFQDTIWDWLDAINAEGGTGYAGHNDWRIPNVRELQSIVDYGALPPAIDPVFGPTAGTLADPFPYVSSTREAHAPDFVLQVSFIGGFIDDNFTNAPLHVRAVRGGP